MLYSKDPIVAEKLFIFYPHITRSADLKKGADGELYAIFEDELDFYEFMDYLDENDVDTSEVETGCWGSWETRAIKLDSLK